MGSATASWPVTSLSTACATSAAAMRHWPEQPSDMTAIHLDVVVSLVENEEDIRQAYHCISEAFGRQVQDAIWMLMNSGWDTANGQAKNAANLIKQWQSTTINKNGDPNAVYLKATMPDPNAPGEQRVAGLAIWKQLSFVEGYGDPFTGDVTEMLETLEESDRRFASQMFDSLWRRRIEYVREISSPESGRSPPAIFVLDLCAVDPAFQRRGIAAKLVEAGLDIAKQRGLECTTEASAMGRAVYRRLGFQDEGAGDIVYEVDEEFRARNKPPNIFLRTRV